MKLTISSLRYRLFLQDRNIAKLQTELADLQRRREQTLAMLQASCCPDAAYYMMNI